MAHPQSRQQRLTGHHTREITVPIATTDHRHPTPGGPMRHFASPRLVGAADGVTHLEITAVRRTLGDAITRALHDTDLVQH